MRILLNKGLNFDSKTYYIFFHSFLCDAPALASIKNVKSHGGYFCCTKCFTKGKFFRPRTGKPKIVYPEINAPLRSNENFRNRISFHGENDSKHHKPTRSVLELLPIDMVDDFPLDKMHLIDEGVFKKLLHIWLGKPSKQKLKSDQVTKINDRLYLCRKYSCEEFQRRIRTFKFASIFKASEYRVLYTGPAVLKGILNPKAYKHFLCLKLALRILTSPVYFQTFNEYASDYLNYFVKHLKKIYGEANITYNVHGLIHIANDALKLGQLDQNSCYKFEAHIKHIKVLIHTENRPLEQLFNRTSERNSIKTYETRFDKVSSLLSDQLEGNKFMTCRFSDYIIKAGSEGNSYLLLKENNTILRVKYFQKNFTHFALYGQKLTNIKVLNNEPFDLKEFFMLLGNFSKEVTEFKIDNLENNIVCKIVCIPYEKNMYFVSPLNQTLKFINYKTY